MKRKLVEVFSFILSVFLVSFCFQNEDDIKYFGASSTNVVIESHSNAVSTQSSNGRFPIGMKEYFSGLKFNFPANQGEIGSCGYVALSQILTYYDTTLNDYIVPESYDVESSDTNKLFLSYNSPGCLYQELDDSSDEAFISDIERTSSTNLQSKLMKIYKEISGTYRFDLQADMMQGVLNRFLSDFFKKRVSFERYSQNDGESTTECTERLKSKVIENIDNGYPCIVGILNKEYENGHLAVAYDYDSNGEIYLNYGWRTKDSQSMSFHSSLSEFDYKYILDLVIIKMDNVPYVASNNYDLNGTKLDSKGNEYSAHTHSLTAWNVYNTNMHSCYCTLCGTEFKEMHNYVGSVCADCGYKKRGGGLIMNTREDD